jgi:hypothetical protein
MSGLDSRVCWSRPDRYLPRFRPLAPTAFVFVLKMLRRQQLNFRWLVRNSYLKGGHDQTDFESEPATVA